MKRNRTIEKRLLIIFIVLIILITAGVFYVNKVVLPTRVRAFIIETLQEKTHKKVSMGSLRLNVFKGLVIRDLNIYDEQRSFFTLAAQTNRADVTS